MKVLAVDDDSIALFMLEEVLVEQLQLEVTVARHGAEAWDLLMNGLQPDFCIFDLMMPVMNGIELTRKLRSDVRFRKMPVVLCTAVGDEEVIQIASDLDVTSYVMKPYQMNVLARELRELVWALASRQV